MMGSLARSLAGLFLCLFSVLPARAEPETVHVGVYVNGVQDVSFKDSKYVVDFYVWFRWRADTPVEDLKPLEAFEVMNGRIDSKSSVVERRIGKDNYASARVLATINEVWQLRAFPFDSHRLRVHIEESAHDLRALRFVPDVENSRLGEEMRLSGWTFSNFAIAVSDKVYKTNYGDVSLPRDAESAYSRVTFAADMVRDGNGLALKILTIVFLSTLVAFVGFGIRPIDLDPRFGLGIGALFAVVASEFIVSSLVPDSGVITLADQLHILALAMIFGSVVVSAWALKLAETDREAEAEQLDRRCLIGFPIVFVLVALAMILMQLPRG